MLTTPPPPTPRRTSPHHRRVEGGAILAGDPGALAAAVNALVRVQEEAAVAQGGAGDPPVLDPVADLKLNSIGGVPGGGRGAGESGGIGLNGSGMGLLLLDSRCRLASSINSS